MLADGPPTAEQLEQHFVSSRTGMIAGEIVVDSSGWTSFNGEPHPYRFRAQVIFDGDLLASTVSTFDPKRKEPDEKPISTEIRCHGDRAHIWYTDATDVNGNKMLANVTELSHLVDSPSVRIADPRYLSAHPVAFHDFPNHEVTAAIGDTKVKSLTVERDVHAGDPCWKTTKRLLSGLVIRTWYSPAHGLAPVAMKAEFQSGDQTFVDVVETKLALHEQAKVWLPTECRHQQYVNGTLHSQDECRISVVQLGHRVDRGRFTLAGLGIPAGTGVQSIPRREPGSQVWDGRTIVTTQPSLAAREVDEDMLDISNWLWIAASAVCSVVAAGCAWSILKRRSSASS